MTIRADSKPLSESPLSPSGARLRILNVTSSVNPSLGGISESILRLSTTLEKMGHHVEIVSVDDPQNEWKKSINLTLHLQGPPQGFFEHSDRFSKWLEENVARFDVIISHGIWRFSSRETRRVALHVGRPYFLFVHGMLDPWFKRYYPVKHFLKSFYWWLTEYAVLRDAASVLFTCEEERELAWQSFRPYRCRQSVVPLGTSPPPDDAENQRQVFHQKFPELEDKRTILFLGRLHVKKGCELLLSAFLKLLQSRSSEQRKELHLMMAGPSFHPDYLNDLHKIAAQCEALSPGSVSFPGMLTGDLKWGALRQAEIFVLPSHQENFGIAVVESLACSTPVLISRPVNIWREIESSDAGLVDEDTEEGCLRLLNHWFSLSSERRKEMQNHASECFTQKFEITQTASILIETVNSLGLSNDSNFSKP